MALPPHAVIYYRYKFKGGVHDGMTQTLPHNVIEITVPALPMGWQIHPVQAQKNLQEHGHVFPRDTKFYYYTSTGKTVEGHLVMEMTGYVDNPIPCPGHE